MAVTRWQLSTAVIASLLAVIHRSSAQVLFQCDFENNMCGMIQDQDDSPALAGSFDWIQYSGKTPTGLSAGGTGPDSAYGGTRYYMYIETSDPQKQYDEARITTPMLNYQGPACVEFYYHMYGSGIGSLELYTSPATRVRRVVWSDSGNNGPQWLKARQTVTLSSRTDMVGWKGIRGSDFRGDIAVDEITIRTGTCEQVGQPGGVVNLPYTCNFEFDFCNMQQRLDDQFDWTRFRGATPTSGTGPDMAPSPGIWYLYIETSDPRRNGDTASIETPTISYTGQACVQFNYHMYGPQVRELQLYTTSMGRTQPWKRWSLDQGNVWRTAAVDVNLAFNDKVGFTGIRGTDIRGDIAIDNLSIQPRRCGIVVPPGPGGGTGIPWACSFEQDYCGMIQSVTDQLDWMRLNMPTETEGTGPSTGAAMTYWFIYMEASSPANVGYKARIETPSLQYDGNACLQFYYHMWGADMGRLQVYTAYSTSNRPIFDEAEDHGNRWIMARLNVQMRSGDRIIFDATRGNDYRSDIAVDEIRIDPGYCPGGIEPGPDPDSTTMPPTEEPPLINYFSCDFEMEATPSSPCRVRQGRDDTFDWSRMSGRTPTGVLFDRRLQNNLRYPVTGPEGAMQGTYYLYIEASGRRNGDIARLILEGPDVMGTGVKCLRFYYVMNGYHTGKLAVYTQSGGDVRRERWSMSGDQLDGWKKAAVELDMTSIVEVGIEGTTMGKFSGDIGIDDIRMSPGPCVSPPTGMLWICTFETSDGSSTLCNMEQDIRDTFNFDWTLWRGPTPSRITGPDRAYNGEYYVYIEASRPRQPGDQARILVPPINYSGDTCVEFMYNMFGFHVGTLSLFKRDGNTMFDQDVWNLSGQQGQQWLERRQTVSGMRPGDRIGFRGVRGGEYSGDIALDNIRVRPGRC